MRRRGSDTAEEWNNAPDRMLRQLSGDEEANETSELSRPQKADEDAQDLTPLVCSETRGWNIDKFAKRFARKHLGAITTQTGEQITPCSVDALYFDGKKDWVFVEFKDDKVILKENRHHRCDPEYEENDPVIFNNTPRNYKAWLQRKLYDTHYIFTESGRCWDSRKTIAYIVVKGGSKNPVFQVEKCDSQGDAGLVSFSNHLHSVTYPHHEIFKGMNFLYRHIYLVDEQTFERKILNSLSSQYINLQ